MRDLHFVCSQPVKNLGVKVLTSHLYNIVNTKTSNDFEEFLKKGLRDIKCYWSDRDYKSDSILSGFQDLHIKVGKNPKKYLASPEVLLRLFLERDRFPRINLLVDLYNLISLRTRLALGAHDNKYVKGDISLRLTNGTEHFLPLGHIENEKVSANEYAYIDDENNIICRMEVVQVESTKITEDSSDIFLIVQGNMNTEICEVEKTNTQVISLIQRFCGGEVKSLNTV